MKISKESIIHLYVRIQALIKNHCKRYLIAFTKIWYCFRKNNNMLKILEIES